VSALAFALAPGLEASEPPEARGIARDEVRLMAVSRAGGAIVHTRFRDLPEHLRPGDLLVINNSATLPAAVPARHEDGSAIEVRFATRARPPAAPDLFVIELRGGQGEPLPGAGRAGEEIHLPASARLQLLAPYAGRGRLWLARASLRPHRARTTHDALHQYLLAHGHPIRYGYVPEPWPLSAYQTAWATKPGSAEMPSAGRPFTPELVSRLLAGGVLIAPITLHCGVSSPERNEPPYAEEFTVPVSTARLARAVRAWGGRIIAVGTTVVRALESTAAPDGTVRAADGWTDLVVSADRPPAVVDGLITGWHEPGASHLQMLEAIAGEALVERSYASALAAGYLWHEFGDSHLILP
jgi:S-adenosylmethionine:tRNA ribosyltransferase-isomerase